MTKGGFAMTKGGVKKKLNMTKRGVNMLYFIDVIKKQEYTENMSKYIKSFYFEF